MYGNMEPGMYITYRAELYEKSAGVLADFCFVEWTGGVGVCLGEGKLKCPQSLAAAACCPNPKLTPHLRYLGAWCSTSSPLM